MPTWFFLSLKRTLISRSFIIIAVILAVSSALLATTDNSDAQGIAVGLLACEDDTVKEAQYALSNGEDKDIANYVIYENERDMKRDLMSGRIRAAYSFDDDFTQKVMRGDYKKLIKCMGNGADILTPLADQSVFSALYRALGPKIAAKRAEEASLNADAVQNLYYDYNSVIESVFEFTDAENRSVSTAVSYPAAGIGACMVLLAALTGTLNSQRDKNKGLYTRLTYAEAYAAEWFAALAPALCMSAVLLAAVFLSQARNSIGVETAKALLLAGGCAAFSELLALLPFKNNGIFIPAVILTALTFTPVFFDLGAYVPALRVVSALIPVYWYLEPSCGVAGLLLYLTIAVAAFVICVFIKDKTAPKRARGTIT